MQVAAPEFSSLHVGSGHWNADDQALLDILLLADPLETPSPARSEVTAAWGKGARGQDDALKSKLSAVERRVRHREVVKRAYHRNKAALKGLRDKVSDLERHLETLSLSKQKPETVVADHVQHRHYAELISEQEELVKETAKLQLLLDCRHQFAADLEAMAHCATANSLDESDMSDSDTATTSSTASMATLSPSSSPVHCGSTSSRPLTTVASGCGVSPLSTKHKTKPSFYSEPRPTLAGPTVTSKAPLAVALRKQLGYKPLSARESTALVNEIYRSVLSFSLSGKAISTGVSIMGWTDKRLLDGTKLKFSLRKQFAGHNALHLMTSTWQCFSNPECTEAKFHGLMTLRILQRVDDDTIVALRETQGEDGVKLYRCVYLLFRVRTRKGFLICVQSVAPERLTDPSLARVSRDGKLVQWTELSGWFVFEPASDCGENSGPFFQEGARVEYGGCMDNGDHESVASLAMNTLSIVFKWESMMVGPTFTLPSSMSW
ncbi:unnamed protein product [Hyaloperonospora brassicae]|uniref:BZIP domain-containing protein n=1 Tax=Hyaloperonospora brassicae TaxID=162125 RepID=A0AAV0U9D7_HYABA|nr:unnamed protein product [Hyaloperonospora brassicae]